MLPKFIDTLNRSWDVLEIHFCIDFGGRQAQIECQLHEEGNYKVKTFVYCYLRNEFTQWNSTEVCDSEVDINQDFFKTLRNMFLAFDDGKR